MSVITQHAPGSFCWFELGTTDDLAARSFYSALFGWKEREVPFGNGGVYRIQQLAGQDCAALYKLLPEMLKQGIPPYWLAYVSVEDVDASAERARQLGGKLAMDPMDVLDAGRMAVVQDPQGAMIALWQAKNHIGVGVVGEANTHCWSELMTRDTAEAQRFYTALFGWTAEAMPMGDMTYTVYKNGDASTAGMMAITPQMGPVPPNWMLYFSVPDCNAFVKQAEKLGAKVLVPPSDVPGVGRFATLMDPQGAAFAVLGRTA